MSFWSFILIAVMLCVGLLLSAFFSGSETGFYRVSRLRLALDGRSGDRIAKALFWLSCRPPLFVATALIGNNLANYLTSLAILLATRAILGGQVVAEIIVPILLAPVVFVYGELFPKTLFFLAPNTLLRRGGPFFLLWSVVLWPLSFLLAWLGKLLEMVLGEAPEAVRIRLARAEIHELLDEGKEVGILRPAQQQLAQAVSEVAHQSVMRSAVPAYRLPSVYDTDTAQRVRQLARESGALNLLVNSRKSRNVDGYLSVGDLFATAEDWSDLVRPLPKVRHTDTHLAALMQMQTGGHTLAKVVDLQGRTVGLVSAARLKEPILRQ